MYIIIRRRERAASASEEIPLCAVPLQTLVIRPLSHEVHDKDLIKGCFYALPGTRLPVPR